MKCFVCSENPSCVLCCNKYMCLLHFYCTNHCNHQNIATVIDDEIYNKYKPSITKVFKK